VITLYLIFFFFSSRRRHTRCSRDWSSDVCSSDLLTKPKDPRRWKNQSVRCPVRNEQIQDRTLAGCPPLYRSDRMFPVIVSSSEGNRRHHVDGLRGFPDRDSHGWRHLRWIGWCLCGK